MAENGSDYLIDDGILAFFDKFSLTEKAEDVFWQAAEDVLSYAKDNAPWSDRTGNARAGLESAVLVGEGEVTLELYHTVDYGLWLEVIQNGRFSIIMPTLELFAPGVFAKAGGVVTEREHEY